MVLLRSLSSRKRAINNSEDNCRLQHRLNVNCQLEVLKYLDVNDLMQVYKLGSYFRDLITKWIIGTKLVRLEINNRDNYSETLQAFGQFMRKLRVSGNDLNFILETIITNCSPATLTEIQILVNTASPNPHIINRAVPYFTNLQKLRLDYRLDSVLFKEFLNQIGANASNLKILQVRGYNIQGEWLRTKSMPNLLELWMHTSEKISIDDLTSFLREHPKLEVFSFAGKTDIAAIGANLSKYCRGLKKFLYEDLNRHNDNFNEVGTNRYDFLSTFTHLDSVTLNSFTAWKYQSMILKSKHIIKEMKVCIEPESLSDGWKIKHSINSKKLEVRMRQTLMDGRPPCKTTYQLIFDILSQMKDLEHVTVECTRKMANFNKILEQILELSPNLRTLSISDVNLMYLPLEIRKIVRTIRNIPDKMQMQKLLHLIVSEEQWREFSIYEDVFDGYITSIPTDSRTVKRQRRY